MKLLSLSAAVLSLVVVAESPSLAGQVKLEIKDGRVTLDAKDATVREIFAEWARVGQTRVVNAELTAGAPMTLQLTGVPEPMALETLLRNAAGYIAAPRVAPAVTGSMYDRIIVMPGVRPAVSAAAGAASPQASQPTAILGRDRLVVQPTVLVDDEDEPVPAMPTAPGVQQALRPGMPAPNQGPVIGVLGPQGGSAVNPYGSPYGAQFPSGAGQPAGQVQAPNANAPGMPTAPATAAKPGVPTPPPKGPGGAGIDPAS